MKERFSNTTLEHHVRPCPYPEEMFWDISVESIVVVVVVVVVVLHALAAAAAAADVELLPAAAVVVEDEKLPVDSNETESARYDLELEVYWIAHLLQPMHYWNT